MDLSNSHNLVVFGIMLTSMIFPIIALFYVYKRRQKLSKKDN